MKASIFIFAASAFMAGTFLFTAVGMAVEGMWGYAALASVLGAALAWGPVRGSGKELIGKGAV